MEVIDAGIICIVDCGYYLGALMARSYFQLAHGEPSPGVTRIVSSSHYCYPTSLRAQRLDPTCVKGGNLCPD